MSVRQEIKKNDIDRIVKDISFYIPREYTGFYQIWASKKHPTEDKKIFFNVMGIRHTDFNKALFNGKQLKFTDEYGKEQEIFINDNLDYYITRNTMNGAKYRGANHLWTITKIVIDIDVSDQHVPAYSYYADAIKLIDTLKRELVFKNELPAFDWVFSGRGVHLHYTIEPIHSEKQAFLADIFVEGATEKINKVLNRYKHTRMYKVDVSASKNHAGLVRYAGINQKSGERVKFHKGGELYHIDDLTSSVGYVPFGNLDIKKEASRAKRTLHTTEQSKNYARGLNIRLEYLQAYREQNSSNFGYRNKMCFLFFNNALSFLSPAYAVRSLYKFNQGFSSPLQKHELDQLVSHLERRIADLSKEERETWEYGKGLYRYRRKTVIETLDITEEEQEHLAKVMNRRKNHSEAGKERTQKQNKKRKVQRKQKREYERQKRLNALRDESLTDKDRAEMFGVSTRTIRNWRKKYLK